MRNEYGRRATGFLKACGRTIEKRFATMDIVLWVMDNRIEVTRTQ